MRVRAVGLYLTTVLATALFSHQTSTSSAGTVSGPDLLQHLNQTITWYQHIGAIDQSGSLPQNVLLQDDVRQTAKQVVIKAFDFARAEAAVLRLERTGGSNPGSAPSTEGRTLEQSSAQAAERVTKLESQIGTLNQQIETAAGRRRETLVSQRDALAADLVLAKEVQSAIDNLASFVSGPTAGSAAGGLLGQIDELAQSDSIPAALNTTRTNPSLAALNPRATLAAQIFHPESAGIVTLAAKAITIVQARMQLDSLVAETNGLLSEIDRLKTPFHTALAGVIKQGDALANTSGTQTDPAQLAAARTQIDQLASDFKQLSAVVMPLGEQGILLEAARGGLAQWRTALNQQYTSVWRYLIIRLVVWAAAIFLILAVSQVLRRATHRYVRDVRRRRQFTVLRRLAIGLAIGITSALALFSGFGSFATVAGFITAGLAVALQNVILAVVAYFFLIGRYGVRVGDRVTVANVTGEVIDIGLVRLYLMELAGSGSDVHTTGRVAVFSNAVIFQPAALLKQAPGTEYTWHAVVTTLDGDADCHAARTRLTGAVESVYDSYREIIEQQHAAFERSINLQMTAPKPVTRVHFTGNGCQILIRYPVEIQHTSDIDERIVKSLLDETEKEPKLPLAVDGAPRIQPAM
jgi:hypothetical protein